MYKCQNSSIHESYHNSGVAFAKVHFEFPTLLALYRIFKATHKSPAKFMISYMLCRW